MKEITFAYKSNPIKVLLPKPEKKVLDDIDLLIKTFKFELDSVEPESSLNKFNQSQENVPIFVRPEFLNYLELNIAYYQRMAGFFNPFSNLMRDDASKNLHIDHASKSVIKLKDFKFNATLLKVPYILFSIGSLLTESGVKEFLVHNTHYYIAKGEKNWDLEVPEYNDLKMQIKNESVYICHPHIHKAISSKPKFASLDRTVNAEVIILESKDLNLVDLRVIGGTLPASGYLEDFRLLSEKWKLSLSLITEQREVIEMK
jgi:hypothetical protein